MPRHRLLSLTLLLAATATVSTIIAPPVSAAEPIRLGVTTILSGPFADRGQSEQYGAQLALNQINEKGGVLGRPMEAYYADNACKPDIGVPATKRLIEQEHVPVIIGALCTPVTRAIEPVVAAAKIPLVIATSAGQDFVDRSGTGGNPYLFKTIPSETDITAGLLRFLKPQAIDSIAIVSDAGGFQQANAKAMEKAATAAGIKIATIQTIDAGTTDFTPLFLTLKAAQPNAIWIMLGPSTAAFFRAYEAAGWQVPLTGRIDIATAIKSVTPAFLQGGGLDTLSSVAVFSPTLPIKGVQTFVKAYQAHYGLMPTQRSFFVYEATYLVADAIRHAQSDKPQAIEAALKHTRMPSLLGGTYATDDHNHAHTPLFILGIRNGQPALLATE